MTFPGFQRTYSRSCHIRIHKGDVKQGRNSQEEQNWSFKARSWFLTKHFATLWTAACQVFPSFTISSSLLKLMSIESVMPVTHLILCCPLLLLPSIFPVIRVFSNQSAPWIRWPMSWSFTFSLGPSNKYSGLISFTTDWLDLLAVQGTLFSIPTVQKHQFFHPQPFLLSSSHIHTWLLGKLQLWLDGPLSAK